MSRDAIIYDSACTSSIACRVVRFKDGQKAGPKTREVPIDQMTLREKVPGEINKGNKISRMRDATLLDGPVLHATKISIANTK